MASTLPTPIVTGAIARAHGRSAVSGTSFAGITLLFALAGAGSSIAGAVVRNRCALAQMRNAAAPCAAVHDEAAAATNAPDWLAFRFALATGRWNTARRLAPHALLTSAGMGEALLVREADRRLDIGDATNARYALDILFDGRSRDPLVWYLAGQAYEHANSPDRAERCYFRGLESEHHRTWAVGRYYLAVLYFKQARWPQLIETLQPLTSGPIEAQIGTRDGDELSRLPDWPAAFLLLGIADEKTGKEDEARNLYRRLLAGQVHSRDWKANRALVSLAALEGRDGAILEAIGHFSSALDLTLSYPAGFRQEYQADTWTRLIEFVRNRIGRADIDPLLRAARAAVDATPRSPGAWLVLAATSTAACRDDEARDAYQRAEALDLAVDPFGARLQVTRADPMWTRCRAQ